MTWSAIAISTAAVIAYIVLRCVRYQRTRRLIVAAPRGGAKVAAMKDLLNITSGLDADHTSHVGERRAITLNDSTFATPAPRPLPPPTRAPVDYSRGCLPIIPMQGVGACPPPRGCPPAQPRTLGSKEPSLINDPAGWLQAQTTGGVEIKTYVPVGASSGSLGAVSTPSRAEDQRSRRLITDIGGRLMAVRQSTRRLAAMQGLSSAASRRASPSPQRKMLLWEAPPSPQRGNKVLTWEARNGTLMV